MLRRAVLMVVAALGLAVAAGPAFAQLAPMEIRGATTVNADGVIKLIESETRLVILDNRRAEDFAVGHIENAKRILDTDLDQAKMVGFVPVKDQPVLFYCNGLSCGRAAKAAEMAVGWGYTKVYYYALGMDEWKKLGLPLTVAN